MRFEFGRNWTEFSRRALTVDRVAQARSDFAEPFEGLVLERKALLDIGFGQGLSLLSVAALGARVGDVTSIQSVPMCCEGTPPCFQRSRQKTSPWSRVRFWMSKHRRRSAPSPTTASTSSIHGVPRTIQGTWRAQSGCPPIS